MATRAVFDAGVPVESLPWGDDVREFAFERGTMPSTPGASSSTPMYVATPRARAPRGIIIVCHTAIGPWETFIRSCCDGLASRGFVAAAPDLYNVGACVFDAETRRERRGGEENRANFGASRVLDAVRAVRASMGSTSTASMKYAAVGFCLGGQVVVDVARGASPSDDVGDAVAVASFHGVLDECALPGRAMRACRVHVYHGTADPFTSAEALERCERDLAERGATRVEVFAFEGARHAFTRPEKVKPEDIEAGFGYDENAARESWRACVSMLHEAFAE